jgi:Flp pilus assembly protein TadG
MAPNANISRAKLPASRFARRLAQRRDGATAVEFAMIALPFMALLIGIFEVGLIFLVGSTLDEATNNITHQVRAGTLQTSSVLSGAALGALICNDRMAWLGSKCAETIRVDVRTLDQYQNPGVPEPIINGVLQPQQAMAFQMGHTHDIVLVRAYYPWPLMAPLMEGMSEGDQHIISATATFRNEPYKAATP